MKKSEKLFRYIFDLSIIVVMSLLFSLPASSRTYRVRVFEDVLGFTKESPSDLKKRLKPLKSKLLKLGKLRVYGSQKNLVHHFLSLFSDRKTYSKNNSRYLTLQISKDLKSGYLNEILKSHSAYLRNRNEVYARLHMLVDGRKYDFKPFLKYWIPAKIDLEWLEEYGWYKQYVESDYQYLTEQLKQELNRTGFKLDFHRYDNISILMLNKIWTDLITQISNLRLIVNSLSKTELPHQQQCTDQAMIQVGALAVLKSMIQKSERAVVEFRLPLFASFSELLNEVHDIDDDNIIDYIFINHLPWVKSACLEYIKTLEYQSTQLLALGTMVNKQLSYLINQIKAENNIHLCDAREISIGKFIKLQEQVLPKLADSYNEHQKVKFWHIQRVVQHFAYGRYTDYNLISKHLLWYFKYIKYRNKLPWNKPRMRFNYRRF